MEDRLGEVLCREQSEGPGCLYGCVMGAGGMETSRGRGCVIEEKGTDSNLSLM